MLDEYAARLYGYDQGDLAADVARPGPLPGNL
jgi:hypothetical protein